MGDQLHVGRAELFDQRIDGAHVVHVCVGEQDAADRCAHLPRCRKNVVGGTRETGVDEAEAISLAHQVTIYKAQACELIGVGSDGSGFHLGNSMRRLSPGSTIRVFIQVEVAESLISRVSAPLRMLNDFMAGPGLFSILRKVD